MNQHEVILDQYTFLDYKESFNNKPSLMPPDWTGDHKRRLQAYMMLDHYFRNSARMWLTTADDDTRDARREYGDPALIVNSVVSSIVGEEGITVHVVGAESRPRPQQTQPIDTNDPTDIEVDDELDDPAAALIDTPTGPELQLAKLREWWDKERLNMKIVENERTAAKLGDSVLVLGWSDKKKRPVVNLYDPGFYFPVYEADGSDAEGFHEEFPSRVHIAYEFTEKDSKGEERQRVRRITWELVEYNDGTRLNVPWEKDKLNFTCWMSDGVWDTGITSKENYDDLDEDKAEWRVRDLDLGIDFIPVIHMPNFPSENEIWGLSSISTVMQVLDDLGQTDTDLAASARITASPPIAFKGGQIGANAIEVYGPGTAYTTEQGMDMVDTSNSLKALIEMDKLMLERLSVNARIPESMLGRIKPNEVPSGIALWLSFAPHSSMIKEMRMVRQEKYALMLKMVSRFYMKDGQLDEIHKPYVKFGSFLPADKKEVMDLVTAGLNSKTPALSLATALRMLQNAGLPIEDLQEEMLLIRQGDFSGASELYAATGDPQDARDYLGLGPSLMNQGLTQDQGGDPGNEPGINSATGLPEPDTTVSGFAF